MNLNEETVNAYKTLLTNPKINNLNFPSLDEIFVQSKKAIAKHLVYETYNRIIGKTVPKVIFYIIMDELFPVKKAEDGNLGYCVEFKINK